LDEQELHGTHAINDKEEYDALALLSIGNRFANTLNPEALSLYCIPGTSNVEESTDTELSSYTTMVGCSSLCRALDALLRLEVQHISDADRLRVAQERQRDRHVLNLDSFVLPLDVCLLGVVGGLPEFATHVASEGGSTSSVHVRLTLSHDRRSVRSVIRFSTSAMF
jgi:hypothetical protein